MVAEGVERSLMDLMHDADPDADFSEGEGDSGAEHGRWARHLDSRRRFRRRLAVGLAAAGVAAVVVGLSWHPGRSSHDQKPQSVDVKEGSVTPNTAKPATNDPGGVGQNPEKTGLPAIPASGGRVRTGTKEQGCFATMREYLDAWNNTGQEPDPCFIAQDPAEQKQPGDVVRSYNGEKF
jgi:hypothetical protein